MSPRASALRHRFNYPTVILAVAVFLAWAPTPTIAQARDTGAGWSATADAFVPQDFHSAPYLGNGRIGTMLPPSGSGYQDYGENARTSFPLEQPRYTGTFLAGFYAAVTHPQYTQVIAALPSWSGFGVASAGQSYDAGVDPAAVHDYSQELGYRTATVVTQARWVPDAEHSMRLRHETFISRARADLAVQRLTVIPDYTGQLEVTDLIDVAAARRAAPVTAYADLGRDRSVAAVRADGTQDTAFVVSAVDRPDAAAADQVPGTSGIRYTLPVSAGTSYTFTKYVGISSTDYGPDPRAAATDAADYGRSHGFDSIHAEHAAQWDRLWQKHIETPGRDDYTQWIRAALYSVLSSVRAGERWSVQPAGLSSDDYAGMTFWDADTFIFPMLLALHPELARTIVDFRAAALPTARANAAGYGMPGALYPWNDGPVQRCGSPAVCGLGEEHLHNEIALAQWQYYTATGDEQWLHTSGAPVIVSIADYLTARVGPKLPDGKYHYAPAAGSDEYVALSVDNALTNGGVMNTMRIAEDAARRAGLAVDPRWSDIAANMFMPPDIVPGVPSEYLAYGGAMIKQADTVLLSYPFTYTAPGYSPADTLHYYFERTDPDGPNMSNSIGAILSAQYHPCRTQHYLDRSVQPYVRGPYHFQAEAHGDRSGVNTIGQSAWVFITGAAGLLQGLIYAPTGLRWTDSGPRLDPVLPSGFPDGITIRGLDLGAGTLDIVINPATTTLTLTSGDPVTVETPGGPRTIAAGQPQQIPTRKAC